MPAQHMVVGFAFAKGAGNMMAAVPPSVVHIHIVAVAGIPVAAAGIDTGFGTAVLAVAVGVLPAAEVMGLLGPVLA